MLELVLAFSLFFLAFLPFLSLQKHMFQFLEREESLAQEEEEFYNAILSFPLYAEETKLLGRRYYHERERWNTERKGALWQALSLETEDKKSYRILVQNLEEEILWETWISKERWNEEKQRLLSSGNQSD